MKGAVTVLFLILPLLAHAEEPTHQEFSFLSSFMQMIAALAIVIGLILLTKYFSGKLLGRVAAPGMVSKNIRLVETRYIAPRKSLILIEVAGEYLLLSSTENQLSLIKQVHIVEEIDVIEDTGSLRTSFSEVFRRNVRR